MLITSHIVYARAFTIDTCEFADHILHKLCLELLQLARANSLIAIFCTLRAFKVDACEFTDHILCMLKAFKIDACEFADHNTLYV